MCEACVPDATMGVPQDLRDLLAEALGDPGDLLAVAGDKDVAVLVEVVQKARQASPGTPDHDLAPIIAQRLHWTLSAKSLASMLTNVAFWLTTGSEAGGQVEDEAVRLADLLDLADDRGGPRTGDDLLKAWRDGDIPVGSMDVLAAGSVYTSHPGQYL